MADSCCDARPIPGGPPPQMTGQHVDGNREGSLPHGAMSPRRTAHLVIAFVEQNTQVTGVSVGPPSVCAGDAGHPAPTPHSSANASTLEGETTVSTWKTVLVGVDGSRGSRKALTWAAAEAAEHGADLVVVHVWERTLPPAGGNPSVPDHVASDSSENAANELVHIIKEELGEDPPVV